MSAIWQGLLDGLGSVLAFLYDLVPNYGVAIILFTLLIRIALLPLAVKQIRSTQAMQRLQPKIRELQKKYKGNRQKLNEAMMGLYKEHGYNPVSGCLPLLAQLPVLFALFAVLRFPGGEAHIPRDSELYQAIGSQQTHFLGANLLCSAAEAGRRVPVEQPGEDAMVKDCGEGFPIRIPYYAFGLAMIGTTFFQQRQMMRATAQTQQPQQQMLMRIMPVLFGVWGFIFPAGLVVYWTTTNAVQIAQQYFMLGRWAAVAEEPKAGQDGKKKGTPRTAPLQKDEPRGKAAAGRKLGADTVYRRRRGTSGSGGAGGEAPTSRGGRAPGSGKGGGAGGKAGGGATGGARNARDRKKRRKR